jgi:hypothetical protein
MEEYMPMAAFALIVETKPGSSTCAKRALVVPSVIAAVA